MPSSRTVRSSIHRNPLGRRRESAATRAGLLPQNSQELHCPRHCFRYPVLPHRARPLAGLRDRSPEASFDAGL